MLKSLSIAYHTTVEYYRRFCFLVHGASTLRVFKFLFNFFFNVNVWLSLTTSKSDKGTTDVKLSYSQQIQHEKTPVYERILSFVSLILKNKVLTYKTDMNKF